MSQRSRSVRQATRAGKGALSDPFPFLPGAVVRRDGDPDLSRRPLRGRVEGNATPSLRPPPPALWDEGPAGGRRPRPTGPRTSPFWDRAVSPPASSLFPWPRSWQGPCHARTCGNHWGRGTRACKDKDTRVKEGPLFQTFVAHGRLAGRATSEMLTLSAQGTILD